jgi:hypothetical protein
MEIASGGSHDQDSFLGHFFPLKKGVYDLDKIKKGHTVTPSLWKGGPALPGYDGLAQSKGSSNSQSIM